MNDDNIYIIRNGDTFWRLEKEWKIPYGTLQNLNPNLNSNKLQVGQKIKMPNLLYLCFIKDPALNYQPIININRNVPSVTDKLYVHKRKIHSIGGVHQSKKSLYKTPLDITNIGLGGMGITNAYRRSAHLSNEFWHLQKNGILVHRWKEMKNGASYWRNNLVAKNMKKFQTLAKSKEIAPRFLKWAGYGGVILDAGVSGELKPSQAISLILIGASGTGVGAIVAGVYFVVDIGFGILTEHSLSERIDNSIGTIEMYEGLY